MLWFDLGDSVESLRRLLWVYEPEKFRNITRFLPRGGGFVDVGANLGDFSIWAAKQGGPDTRVLAVEADPDNLPLLNRNLRRHRLDGVVHVAPVAAAAEPGTVVLHQGHQSGTSTISPSEVHELEHMRPRGTVEIPAKTLDSLIDWDLLNSGAVRLSVGAVEIESGNFRYFDTTQERIDARHIMASGALPPGLPPVEIDGKYYWDGGLVSNTPLTHVLDHQTCPMLVFQVDLFSSAAVMPRTITDVMAREKEIRFSSRTRQVSAGRMRLRQERDLLKRAAAFFATESATR